MRFGTFLCPPFFCPFRSRRLKAQTQSADEAGVDIEVRGAVQEFGLARENPADFHETDQSAVLASEPERGAIVPELDLLILTGGPLQIDLVSLDVIFQSEIGPGG